jgi:hypothetical protein
VASAAAMSMLIVLVNVVARLGYGVLTQGLQKRVQAWITA